MQWGTMTGILFSLFRQVASSSSLAQHFLTEVAIDKTLQMLGNLSGNLGNGVCHQVSEKYVSVWSSHAKSLLYNNKAMRGFVIRLLLAPTSGFFYPCACWNTAISPLPPSAESLEDGLKHCHVQAVGFFLLFLTFTQDLWIGGCTVSCVWVASCAFRVLLSHIKHSENLCFSWQQ